jgi:hypothetical protein
VVNLSPGCFTPEKEPWYPLSGRLTRLQSRSGGFEEEKISLSELSVMAFSLGDDVQWLTDLNLRDVLGRNALKLEAFKKLVTLLSKHTSVLQ